jgi:hypothetical protein
MRGKQLNLFGVEAAAPRPADLAGLLAGPGQVVRMGGTARVSVVVDTLWRARTLHAELAERGIGATLVATVEEHIAVRSAYTTVLAPLGAAWLRGAVKLPPPGFWLDGRRLRLWVLAAGHADPLGFTLRLVPPVWRTSALAGSASVAGASTRLGDDPAWVSVGMALAAAGLPGALLGARAGGPAYRIVGRRRIGRLAELVGDRPPGVPDEGWPTS